MVPGKLKAMFVLFEASSLYAVPITVYWGYFITINSTNYSYKCLELKKKLSCLLIRSRNKYSFIVGNVGTAITKTFFFFFC